MPEQYSRRKFIKNISIAGIATTGITTFLENCTNTGINNFRIDDHVKCAFRLTDHNSLLNLEFYFINCKYDGKKVSFEYGPHENYMIVRLPQQHIAEQNFPDDDKKTFNAAIYISGYSYLVFRILFPRDPWIALKEGEHSRFKTWENGKHTSVKLSKADLVSWDDERKFRLVVRQDLTESLFELRKYEYFVNRDSAKKKYGTDSLDNHYPFQQINKKDSSKSEIDTGLFRIDRIPKVYGDPITAIELPWRLIISPRLPDSSKFKFKWDFPGTDTQESNKHRLWTATLSIIERTDEDYINRKNSEAKRNKDNKQASTGSLNDIIDHLELMILGSPDYKKSTFNNNLDPLPNDSHRNDLVALYIKLKVLARTEKLTFSPLGATTHIHLKNNRIEEALGKGIGIIEWDHVISLGRDEKVEVSTLFLEAEFGHKMAYVQIAERKLKNGVYPLIRKACIVPLDISRDYTNHITQTFKEKNPSTQKDEDKIHSRFNSPFKKITFLETKPKELLLPPGKVFNQKNLNQTETSFEFEAIDWHDNIVKYSKKINALPFGAVVDWDKKETTDKEIFKDNTVEKIVTDTLIYKSDTTRNDTTRKQLISDSTRIPFLTTDSINNKFKDSVETEKQLKALNDSLHLLKKLDSTYVNNTSSSNNLISNEDSENQISAYFNEFFQFTKNLINELYLKTELTYKGVIDKINNIDVENIKDYFINKYIFSTVEIYNKIKIIYESELQDFNKKITDSTNVIKRLDEQLKDYQSQKNQFERYLQKVLLYDANSEEISELPSFWEDFNEKNKNIKGIYEKWIFISVLYNHLLKDYNSDFAKQLNQRLIIQFPNVIKEVDSLKELFKKLETSGGIILIDNIRHRIRLFYEIEEIAKNIPNLILLQKQKIGYAIKEKYDNERQKLIDEVQEGTKQVKKSLSELESEYIIFKGALRQAEKDTFDFFHEYAIIPQVEQAKVYVSALNKLVNEDIPININYAREYLENQVEDAEFEVKQNAAMVFAEVKQYSRDQLKGLIQKIGNEMPGINVEIPVHYLTYLRNPNDVAVDALNKIEEKTGYDISKIKDYSKDLVFISEQVKDAVKTVEDLKNIDPKKYFRDLGAKLFGSINLEDILDIGFDIPRLTELPDKLIYQVSTEKFQEHRAAFVVFKPNTTSRNDAAPTRLDLFIKKSLKNINEYYAYTGLNDFSVGVIIGGKEVLTVTFNKFEVSSSPNQPNKTDISIGDVKLGGPLEFIADLAKKFLAPGEGMKVKPGPKNLALDYAIAFPAVSAPAFNFRNLQLVIGLNIPYDPGSLRPISFTFGVNKPEDKFLVSAGIYGGRGHFLLRATPKGIEHIDIAIEMGAYASIELGIGRGEVFMFFGFWFVCGTDAVTNENTIKAVAYVICSGSATVLGFISIGVSVLISLTYEKRGQAAVFYGEAVVTYSVKVALFKKTFSIHYRKEIVGSSEGNGTNSLPAAGFILMDAGMPGRSYSGGDKDKVNFDEVFKDEKELKNYLSCFA